MFLFFVFELILVSNLVSTFILSNSISNSLNPTFSFLGIGLRLKYSLTFILECLVLLCSSLSNRFRPCNSSSSEKNESDFIDLNFLIGDIFFAISNLNYIIEIS